MDTKPIARVIPFARMSHAQKINHLNVAHNFSITTLRDIERSGQTLAKLHTAHHRAADATGDMPHPHEHTKVTRH